MRDLAEKWSPVPDWESAALETPDVTISSLAGFSQYLVSGNFAAWAKAVGMDAKAVGAQSVAAGGCYAVGIARDRILAMSDKPFGIAPGWHEDGFAVSAMDAGLIIFEIDGPGLTALWARASTLDFRGTTPSASILFAGVNVICYRHGHGERLRVHVDRGLAPYLWKWLEQALAVQST